VRQIKRHENAFAAAALLDPSSLLAQDADDIGHAERSRGQFTPISEAPPFPVLATTPGKTTICIDGRVADLTSAYD
jgi:hypothetical protein